MDITNITTQITQCLDKAKHAGVQCQIAVDFHHQLSVEVKHSLPEQLCKNNNLDIHLIVLDNHKKSSASSNAIENIDDLLETAIANAKLNEVDPTYALPDAHLLAKQADIDTNNLGLYKPYELPIESAIEQCIALEQIITKYDKRLKAEITGFESSQGFSLLANTHDWLQIEQSSHYSMYATAIANQQEQKQMSYEYDNHFDYHKLASIDSIGERCAQKTLAKLNPQPIPSKVYPIIFTPKLARWCIRQFIQAISGMRVYKKSTFLLDALNTNIMPSWLTIRETCSQYGIAGSSRYDNEGVATIDKTLIQNGALMQYVFDCTSGRKLKQTTTGNCGYLGVITCESAIEQYPDQEALIQTIDEGILVSDIMGNGSNIVTGDVSVGASGQFIKNGQIVHAVDELTIAINLRDAFQQIRALANDIDTRSNIHIGSMLVDGFAVASR